MSDWVTGKTEATEAEWQFDGSAVTTGSATATYWRQNGATKEFLQSDGITFGSGANSFSLALVGSVWRRTFTVPTSMDGFTVHEEVRHSDTDLPVMTESHYVTATDLDSDTDFPSAKMGSAGTATG